jgi:hypothetical protein
MRTAAVAATAKLDEERRRPRATQPAPVSDEVPADGADGSIESGVMPASIPEPEPTPPTLEERAQVYLRIGLDEASRQLGEPAHAIEGMSPTFIGLAEGRLLSGADTSRPVVRAVYLDPNGNLILLDQQQIRPGQPAPVATPDLWSIGSVLVSLHGEVPPQAISNLRSRLH